MVKKKLTKAQIEKLKQVKTKALNDKQLVNK